MLEESIRLIRETETQLEEEKTAARVRGQKLAAEAEQDAAAILAAAEETLRRERAELLAEVERHAAARREEILADAERQCGALTAQAAQRQAAAVEKILARGGVSAWPS